MFSLILLPVFPFLVLFSVSFSQDPPPWPNHDISTLKLLQFVHRHGDRNALDDHLPPSDPFFNESNWQPEGYGGLTAKGRYRMWHVGKALKHWYGPFLDNTVVGPKNIKVRSSIEHRCIESVGHLLAGFYQPTENYTWGDKFPENGEHTAAELGNVWMAFPIETFMPKSGDPMLANSKECKILAGETEKEYQSEDVKKMFDNNKELIKTIKDNYKFEITNLRQATHIWDSLFIEKVRGYLWPGINKTQNDEVLNGLEQLHQMDFQVPFRNPIVNKARAGPLIREIANNMKTFMDEENNYSFWNRETIAIFSTHDTKLAVLMNALGIFKSVPSYGAVIIFELHQDRDGKWFVKLFVLKNTDKPDTPEEEFVKLCNASNCSFDMFYQSVEGRMLNPVDWDEYCGNKIEEEGTSDVVWLVVCAVGGFVIGLVLAGLVVGCIFKRKKKPEKDDFEMRRI